MLHSTIRSDNFWRNTSLQCWNNVVTIRNNVAAMLQRCVALKNSRCKSSRVTLPHHWSTQIWQRNVVISNKKWFQVPTVSPEKTPDRNMASLFSIHEKTGFEIQIRGIRNLLKMASHMNYPTASDPSFSSSWLTFLKIRLSVYDLVKELNNLFPPKL